jgi:maltose alpha-D-glucosyltransferase/alpha-amylase
MVTHRERDYMYQMYAADPRARVNLGIRRRLAPLMQNDADRIKLMNSLLLSMPGSPIIYYGDEIGMGDNIYLGDRNAVRTPMQWSPDRNAGFSRADPQRLYLPPIMDSIYGYEAVNVESQLRDPSSLLHWMRRIFAVRKTSQAFGRGKITFLRPGNRKVLAYLREHGEEAILCVANVSRSAQPVELDLSRFRGRVPVEMIGRNPFPPIGELPYLLTLPAHGFFWFRLAVDVEVPKWHEERLAREDLPVVVLFDGWTSLFRERVVPWRMRMAEKIRAQFEQEVLPRHLEAQRWYGAKGEPIKRAKLTEYAQWSVKPYTWLLTLIETEGGTEPGTYFVPLALAWESGEEERLRALAPATIARVRQQANVGAMADALSDENFCRAVVQAIEARAEVAAANGTLRFMPTGAFGELAGEGVSELPVGRPQVQSSNTVVTLGQRLFLKGYRRIRAGVNPELEVGRYLTEVANFPNCARVAGALEYVGKDGTQMTLALLQGYVSNQGDGWNYTVAYLERFFESHRAAADTVAEDAHGAYLSLVRTLGKRTAELHLAFAFKSGDPAFDPEPVTPEDLAEFRRAVHEETAATLKFLERQMGQLVLTSRQQAQMLLDGQKRLFARIDECAMPSRYTLKTRYHGDYHLAQVLVASNDFIIIDFEGEPARPLAERTRKYSPLRDVAGMLRSFNYARWTALRRVMHAPEDGARLAPLAATWEPQVRSAFLEAYDEAARGSGLYASFEEIQGLIQLFELEKALYELRYEINNRPGWARIPLEGILALAGLTRGEGAGAKNA